MVRERGLPERRVVFAGVGREIFELRIAVEKGALDTAGGSVALLGENELGDPFQPLFIGAVDFLAKMKATMSASLLTRAVPSRNHTFRKGDARKVRIRNPAA